MDIEKIRDKKWEYHNQTDKREKMIDEYEKENDRLTPVELEKVRAIYNNYTENHKEFKKEYIDIIKSIIRKKTENIKDDKEDYDKFRI